MKNDVKEVTLHNSQAMIQIINANTTYCTWQRGGGKTGGGIGPRIQRLMEVMPRSQILLFSDTFDRLQTRIVPNIINFLEDKLGLIEGVDFIKYKKPPDSWDKPLIPLDKFENVISFSSGMALCLVSLRVEGSANAFNAQTAIGDEVKFCDETKINNEVLPSLRGAEKLFGHLPEYLSVWMFTDKFGGSNIKWILGKRKLVNQKAVDVVYTLQMEIWRLEKALSEVSSSATIVKYQHRIKELNEKANKLRKQMVYFSDMKPYENRETLGEFYFKRQRRICKSEMEYNIAILNMDPDKVEQCFYPTFTALNKYHCAAGADYDATLPFYTAFDYNFRIAPMPIVQVSEILDSPYTTTNFIDALYTLHPLGIVDVINEFCVKYDTHINKVMHYIYDHTAIGRNPLKTTYKDEVVKAFELNGWTVVEHYIGDAPDHEIKFGMIKNLLVANGDYAVRLNEDTCSQLIKSIEQSPAKLSTTGQTKKDKKTETDTNFPAEDSTHFSDAFDMILWGLFEHDIINTGNTTGLGMRLN
jgi:FtsZ-binding cell division protein ZapB